MSSSIQDKINRSIQALNVHSVDRLLANMQVIEGYIDRKPVFLEWIHEQVFVDAQGRPTGFSTRFNSPHSSTVKLWLLTMYARCGDMVLQGVERLDLSLFERVHFPKHFNDCFRLSVLHLPQEFYGVIPRADVCWVYSSDLHRISTARFLESNWVVVLTGNAPDCLRDLPRHRVIGIDASQVSRSIFQQWCDCLQAAPLEFVELPGDSVSLETLPDWSETLKVLSAPPTISRAFTPIHIRKVWNVEMLYLSNWRERRPHHGVSQLPPSLFLLENLRWLDVSRNPIQYLPPETTSLQRLHTLNIANTNLLEFPINLIQLMSLERLFIRNTNASKTREWLNILTEGNNSLSVKRVVHEEKSTLWCLCIQYSSLLCIR